MRDILIRGLGDETVRRLKSRAKRHGRSLQKEAKLLLEKAAAPGEEEIAAMLERWKRTFAGRRFSSSVELIRGDRDR